MYKILIFSLLTILFACDSGPKVIEAETIEPHNHTGAGGTQSAVDAALPAATATTQNQQHKVVAKEFLDTEKYTYIKVEENGEEFWIATTKTPIETGATYYYQGGLIKKDFFSREHNRTFETLYLVGGISKQPAGTAGGSAVDQALGHNHPVGDVAPPSAIQAVEGAIKIGDLVKNKAKYAGKTVKLTGKVMKVNPMIMGRNWLHLQDGSGENYDLVVTSMENIPPGHVVTLEGTVVLDKDFGAGYRYDILVEGAALVR